MSPVIAVVLLIALTVAAGAVIWVIASGYLETPLTINLTSTTTASVDSSASFYTFAGVMQVQGGAVTVTDVALLSSGTDQLVAFDLDNSVVGNQTTLDLAVGETSVSFTLDTADNGATAGTYQLQVTYVSQDGGANEIVTFDVTFS